MDFFRALADVTPFGFLVAFIAFVAARGSGALPLPRWWWGRSPDWRSWPVEWV